MNYLSICSGIEAATQAWHPLGWSPVAFSEIEKFPSAVLAHHYPNVPNWGDMTKFKEWPDAEVDVLVGGTPCQSFSVAGLRAGLADPRGNLALTFLAIAKKYDPMFVVWENVPGVLSSGDAFDRMLLGFNELGYAVDCDILDAQHFGVPQRRRRVFLVCHNVRLGWKRRTKLFANTVGTFLTDALLSVLDDRSDLSNIADNDLKSKARFSADGLSQRMRLFGLLPEGQNPDPTEPRLLLNLLKDWTEALEQSKPGPERSGSVSDLPSDQAAGIVGERLSAGSLLVSPSMSTQQLWSEVWAALWGKVNASTTSTATRVTTTRTISTCAVACLSIVQYITKLTTLQERCFDGDGFVLTALKAYTRYARQANNDLFEGLDSVCDWGDYARAAEDAICVAERHLGNRAHTGTLFPIPESLSGNPPPRREAGEGTTDSVAPCIGASGRGFERAGETRGQDPVIAHTLKGEGFDASEDGTGRGTPLVPEVATPVLSGVPNGGPGHGARSGHAKDGTLIPVAFDTTQVTSKQNYSNPKPGEPCHPLAAGAHPPAVATSMAVRQLTPVECERLQGFPDNFTRIPWRGKEPENCPDGPRYKALGNSMAVNCMEWIGRRIVELDR